MSESVCVCKHGFFLGTSVLNANEKELDLDELSCKVCLLIPTSKECVCVCMCVPCVCAVCVC